MQQHLHDHKVNLHSQVTAFVPTDLNYGGLEYVKCYIQTCFEMWTGTSKWGHFKILLSLTSRIKIKHTDWKMETQFNHLPRPVDAGVCVE